VRRDWIHAQRPSGGADCRRGRRDADFSERFVVKEEGTASTSYDDENENDTNIVSTIEPLTGITREKLEKEGIPFADGKN